jgi:hypothetical protein
MFRTLALAASFSLITSAAQAQKADPAALDAAKKTWAGLWEGPVWHLGESDPIGGFRLEIGHDSVWKVSIDVVTGQTTSGKGLDFVPDGTRATWKSALMGRSCGTKALLEGQVLKGETTCGEGSGLAFELRKKQ